MADFDVIICTYNRPKRAQSLISQVLECTPAPEKIVVVDSTEEQDPSEYARLGPGVTYLKSSHKNQPYQRFLGFQNTVSDVLVFLDDDVKILDQKIFQYMLSAFSQEDVKGACIRVRYENVMHDLLEKKEVKQGRLLDFINKISGVPSPAVGKLGLVGVPGPLPDSDGEVEFFQGTNMAFKREAVEKAFDSRVFSQYEYRIGKGEDKILSFKVASLGKLMFLDREVLHHPPVETSYFDHSYAYYKRLAYSRYFLTRIWCEERSFPLWLGVLHYYYFMAWRLLIAIGTYVKGRSSGQKEAVKGMWKGVKMAFSGHKAYRSCSLDWKEEVRKDCESR
ncbi:glycosyltransferase family 2 protein [Roseivirga sp. BDSF3-8]|uniref:glycosyltransferase family 2 protein n=1 Tax=Roseivirga sp. BDSF3-8 TaxID=3241598 RepID=UPI0035320731